MNSDVENPTSSSVDWDESGQPVSLRFDDVYFSKESGIDESRYVFIENNHLTRRWRELKPNGTFLIGETGFGTGLNFLATWAHWNKSKPGPNARLHFFSVEKYPLTKPELIKALSLWPELRLLSTTLIAHYPPANVQGNHRLALDNNSVCLTIYFGDAVEGLAQCMPATAPVDAWYLDGFAPAKNPDMWSDDLFNQIARLSSAGTTFATFTAAGKVRRGLENTGFHCEKVRGFGRKREMLVGEYLPQSAIDAAAKTKSRAVSTIPLWCIAYKNSRKKVRSALVIGGGLAGCHTAYALANRNIKVTIVEQEKHLASKGSGNAQGVVYTKLSPHSGMLSDFNLYAQIYANHFYSINPFFKRCGDQCGVIHLAIDKKTADSFIALDDAFRASLDFARFISVESTEHVSGLNLRFPGLYIEKAGWLNPAKLCGILTEHANIDVVTNFPVTQLDYCEKHKQWRASDHENNKALAADIAVIANAQGALQFDPCRHLPLKTIRGQVSHIPADCQTNKLRCVVCGESYIAPAVEGVHYCGATYRLNNQNVDTTVEEHEENIRCVAGLGQDLNFDEKLALTVSGRVGFRCTTPDYFPIVGPAPIFQAMQEEFAFLRKKAKAIINNRGHYYPDLYLNIGYGSRGLAYAPLCADLLASVVCFEPLPISGKMVPYLHPARFIIRDLQRNKI